MSVVIHGVTLGLILALHKNRAPNDFTVIRRIIPEFPKVDVRSIIDDHMKTGAYVAVWFQPLTVWPTVGRSD